MIRRLIMSAWLIFAAVLIVGLVSGGFCAAGYIQGDLFLWGMGGAWFVVIAVATVFVLRDYWRVS